MPRKKTIRNQVEQVKAKAGKMIEQMSKDENVTVEKFYKSIAAATTAFKIMDNALELGEQMEKLKKRVGGNEK